MLYCFMSVIKTIIIIVKVLTYSDEENRHVSVGLRSSMMVQEI